VVDRNGQDGSNDGTHLLLMNIHDRTPLLKLLLPFNQPPYSITFFSNESGIHSSKNYNESGNTFNEASGEPSGRCLVHDPIADRIGFLRFHWRHGNPMGMFISLSKIVRLLSSPLVTSSSTTPTPISNLILSSSSTSTSASASILSSPNQPVLNWTDWGPSSTRVFHCETHRSSICGSRGLLVTKCKELLRYSSLYSERYAETSHWVFLDFNQRLIRYQAGSTATSLTQCQTGKSPDTEQEETSVLEAESVNPARMETVTETWNLNSKNATGPIESSLPFRILVPDRFGDHAGPALGMDYFVAGKV
jgi:hypothetical protein